MTTDRTKRLLHVTPSWNENSITVYGLDRRFTRGQKLWFVTAKNLEWAIDEVFTRYRCDRVIIYEVKVRRHQIVKQTLRGHGFIWRSGHDYPPCKLAKLGYRSRGLTFNDPDDLPF